jgi:hypothetical protein
MTTTKTTYGRYEHGKPDRGEGGCWHRIDTYFSDDPDYLCDPQGKGLQDLIHCAGPNDDSGYFKGQYDGAHCPCCYLGHGHTEALHAKYVQPKTSFPADGWKAEPRDLPGNGQDDLSIPSPSYPQI